MSRHNIILIAAGLTTILSTHVQGSGLVFVNMTPSQASYVVGEPIDIVLTIRNDTDETVSFEERYPDFASARGTGGISLVLLGGAVAKPKQAPRDPWLGPRLDPVSSLIVASGPKIQLASLAAGKARTFKVFLQQFAGDLPPGAHNIAYTFDIDQVPREGPHIQATGQFTATIVSAGAGELAEAIAQHAKEYETSDYWTSRAAEEGLLIVNSPLVIPYLTRIKPWGDYEVVLAMEKFKGNHDAEDYVLGQLRSGGTPQTTAALYVLQQWKYALSESEVSHLLNSGKAESRLAAIRYVYHLPGGAYQPEVRALVVDPDVSIAEAARRVVKAAATPR
jgi:hypothetical protein